MNLKKSLLAPALCATVLGAGVMAQQPQTSPTPTPTQAPRPALVPTLKVGDKAPAFTLPGSDGKTHKLSDYKGKTVVISWFPQAFTGG